VKKHSHAFPIQTVVTRMLRLRGCVSAALASTIQLVSRCCQHTPAHLEQVYRKEASLDFFEADVNDPEDADELIENEFNEKAQEKLDQVSQDEVKHVLGEIEDLANDELEDVEVETQNDDKEVKPPVDSDALLPDGADLVSLTSVQPDQGLPEEDFLDSSSFPRCLKGVLQFEGSMWVKLWQFAVVLRCGDGAMDGNYLRKGEQVRQRSRKLNWHQCLV